MPSRNEPWATLLDDLEREGWRAQYVLFAGTGVQVKEGVGILGSIVKLSGPSGAFALYDGLSDSGAVMYQIDDPPLFGNAAYPSTGELWVRFNTGLFATGLAGTAFLLTYR